MVTGKTALKDCLKELLDYNLSFVAITMGSEGCVYATKKYMGRYPEFPANVVDTTGAGDTFWGTFLFGLLKSGGDLEKLSEDNISELVLMANIAAAMSTEKKGAIPSIPDLDRVRKALVNMR